jgi:hypothetical protein
VTTTFTRATPSIAESGFQGTVPVVPSALDFVYTSAGTISGTQVEDGKLSDSPSTHDELPFQRYDVTVPADGEERHVRWSGVVDPARAVRLLVWDTGSTTWVELASARGTENGDTALDSAVSEDQVDAGVVHVMVIGEDPFADDLSPRDASANADEAHFEDPADVDFSFLHWTDTQFLSEAATGGAGKWPASPTYATSSGVQTAEEQAIWAKSFSGVVDWTKANATKHKLAYLGNTGDIINNDIFDPDATDASGNLLYPGLEEQIHRENDFASGILDQLTGTGVPVQLIAGNHDNQNGAEGSTGSRYTRAFPASDGYAAAQGWPAGASYHTMDEVVGADGTVTPGSDSQNNYVLFTAGGQDFVSVGLSYGVTQAEADWATSVFERYRDRNGILITHGYLGASANLDGRGAGLAADGNKLYKQVVAANPNVFLVLAGHVHGVGTNLKTIAGAEVSHKVVELLADYQEYQMPARDVFTSKTCATCVIDGAGNIDVDGNGVIDHAPTDSLRFGASWMRLLQFDTEASTMSVDTYSPFFDKFGNEEYSTTRTYNGAENNFTVPVNLTSRTTSFSTDALAVVTPGDEVIGTVTGKSGFPQSVTWSGLTAGQTYAWTATSRNAAGADLGEIEQFGGIFVASNAGTDTLPPVLAGVSDARVTEGDAFDPRAGVTATDVADGDLTSQVTVTGTVDTSVPGVYTLLYAVADANGNQAQAQRAVRVVAKAAPVLTRTSVSTGDVSVDFGRQLTMTAKVTPATATGVVRFVHDEELLCEAPVVAGTATCTDDVLPPPDTYAVVATYSGDATHEGSFASSVLTVRSPADTTVVDSAVRGTSSGWTYGDNGVAEVTVTAAKGIPTGGVALQDGKVTVGWTALVDGRGTVTLATGALTPGKHSLTLAYSGDLFHRPSTGTVEVDIARAAVRAPASAVRFKPEMGPRGSVVVRFPAVATGLERATGQVRLRLTRNGVSRTVKGRLREGRVRLTLPGLAAGRWKAVVRYAGDDNYRGVKKRLVVRVR